LTLTVRLPLLVFCSFPCTKGFLFVQWREVGFCAGYRTPAVTTPPHVRAAGVWKAPRNEPARAGREKAARIAPATWSIEDDGAGVPSW